MTVIKHVSLSRGAVPKRNGRPPLDQRYAVLRCLYSAEINNLLQDLQQRGRDGVPAGEQCGGVERGWSLILVFIYFNSWGRPAEGLEKGLVKPHICRFS